MSRVVYMVIGMALLVAPSMGHSQTASITPSTFTTEISLGQTIEINKTITLASTGPPLNRVDVFFLADNTGSMGDIIETVKSNAATILSAIAGGDPRFTGIDVGFGVGRYVGDPREGVAPTTAYELLQAITTDQATAQSALNNWFALSVGGDEPEANFFALHQVATEGGSTNSGVATNFVTEWRPGTGRVIVWFGDARSHTDTVNQAEAIAALTSADVTVVGINTQSAGFGIDDNGGQATAIVNATGGTLTNGVTGASASATIDAILNAVESVVTTIDLRFDTVGDTSGLDISFTCTDPLGCSDVPAGASRTFRMTITGLATGRFQFDTIAVGVDDAVERDDITVDANELPVLESIIDQGARPDRLLTFTVRATDLDVDDTVFLSIGTGGLPIGADFDATPGNPAIGRFTWTPASDQEAQIFTVNFVATDDFSPPGTDSEAVRIAVGRYPVPSTGTDPTNPDTDNDEFSDGEEVNAGSDPLDSESIPGPL